MPDRITRRRVLAAIAAAGFGIASPALAGPGESAAETFVRSLYALPQLWADVTADSTAMDRYLDPDLAALVAENYAKTAVESALDYDPLIQAPDVEALKTDYTVDAENEAVAVVTVAVENFGETTFVHLDLVMTQDGWRLADIRASDNTSLVGELKRLNAAG
jgi:hypothetical protein